MKLLVIGPGRAGGAMAIASARAGHEIVGVISRTGDDRYGPPVAWSDELPAADLALIAVRDAQIGEASSMLANAKGSFPVVAHLSGFIPVTSLGSLAPTGAALGGFHPLQTLPDAESGAEALEGSFVAIAGEELACDLLTHLAGSLRMRPFPLSDEMRPAYHAAAAAAANFIVTCLATSADLMRSAGVEPSVTRPLVERVVSNAFSGDAGSMLTGPIARGDLETVVGHLTAAHEVSDDVGEQFRLLAEATAIRAGRGEDSRLWS